MWFKRFSLVIISFIILIVAIIWFVQYREYKSIDFAVFDEQIWNQYVEERKQMIDDFEGKYPIESLTFWDTFELLGTNEIVDIRRSDYMIFSGIVFYNTYSIIYKMGGRWSVYEYHLVFDEEFNCIQRYTNNDGAQLFIWE